MFKPITTTHRLSMNGASLLAFFLVGLLLAAPAVCLAQVTITEYPVPTGGQPQFITAGPDGNLWFTKSSPHDVGKITPAGVITPEFPTGNNPAQITVGPDGNLWFAEEYGNNIGRINTAGVLTEFPVPTNGCHPAGITAGPDGNLWFTEAYGDKIGRITPTGVITEFPVGRFPASITAGPDGNLWFAEAVGNQIGRLTIGGVFTEFPVPTSSSYPYGITVGPDGSLWFTECACATSGNPAKIGRITTAGLISEYSVPTLGSSPTSITAGPDGNLWFTEHTGNQIGRITTAGVFTEFPVSTTTSLPIGITVGPDGNLWFTDDLGKIGKLTTNFAFLGSGSFVIGDRDAVVGNTVTFWGSHWAEVNSLNGGPAPNAFKGFADTAPQSCGGSWTSDPGNSSKPPDTVPSYMAVIASSSVTKAGPTISGNVPMIVVVQTNPGYGPAPGHTGTGTVVAVLCSNAL